MVQERVLNFLSKIAGDAQRGETFSRPAIHRDWILLAAVTVVIGLDQLTKHLVREYMARGQSIPEEGFFRLTYHTNSGTIFGLFPSATQELTVISILAIGFLVYFYWSQKTLAPPMRLSIGMLIGGAIGNLIDRLSIGRVTDFVDVGRWPIFNVADASITVGIFLLIVFTIFPNISDDQSPNSSDAE